MVVVNKSSTVSQQDSPASNVVPFEVNGKIITGLFPEKREEQVFAPCITSDFSEVERVAKIFANLDRAVRVSYDQFKGMYRIDLLTKPRPINQMNATNNSLSDNGIFYRTDQFLAEIAESILEIGELKFLNYSGKTLGQELRGAEILEVGPYGKGSQTRVLLEKFPGIANLHMIELDPRNFLEYLPSYESLPRHLRAKVRLECGDCSLANPNLDGYGLVFINNVLVELFYSQPQLAAQWLSLISKVRENGVIHGLNDKPSHHILDVALKVLGSNISYDPKIMNSGEIQSVDTVVVKNVTPLKPFIDLELQQLSKVA
jgi:hypothetical protein